MADSSTEPTLPKILLKYEEFHRLKYIEEEYLLLKKKFSSLSIKSDFNKDLEKSASKENLESGESSSDENNSSLNQTGLGGVGTFKCTSTKSSKNQTGFGEDSLNQISNLVFQKLLTQRGKNKHKRIFVLK